MYDRDAVNHHIMKKQGLVEPFNGPAEALKALGLIDASILPAAYYTLFARSKSASLAAVARAAQAGRHMARLPGLKGLPQLIPREMMPYVFSLTRGDREDRAGALLENWGIDRSEHDWVRKAIRDALGEKEKTLSQLKNTLPVNTARDVTRRRGKRVERSTNIAIVAQAMWQRWELLRGGVSRSPFEDPGRYSSFERRFGLVKLGESRTDSVAALARRYVECYGPVSDEDFAWWAGLTKGEAAAAFAQLKDVTQVEIHGVDGQFFMASSESIKTGRQPRFPVRMLATDDPYVKAYSHRGRFVPLLYEGIVITKFGELSPVVLVDGVVHGLWSLSGRTCVIEMVAGPEDAEKEIRAAAANAGRFFTGGPVDIVFTAFRQKA